MLAGDLRITEINYHPYEPMPQFGDLAVDSDEFEFIELANVGDAELDLTGVQLLSVDVDGNEEGVEFEFGSMTLLAGEQVVVVENLAAFQSRYGTTVNVAGQWSGGLSNGGERITLVDEAGSVIQSFDYNDSGSWPARADGIGSTLEVVATDGDYDSGSNWRASNEFGGTPGAPGTGPVFDVIVNEVLSHSDGDALDQVELFNTTGDAIELTKWYISDESGDLLKFQTPDGTMIGGSRYLIFNEAQLGFALDGQFGDDLWLIDADAATGKPRRFAEELQFDATLSNVSLGRWANNDPAAELFPMTEPTIGGPNSGPVIGEVIISEVHYNPNEVPAEHAATIGRSELEFVELYNQSGGSIDIGNWKVDGVNFTFPSGTSAAAGEAIVLVTFDPALQSGKTDAFREVFDVAAGVRIFGPAAGQLNNAGESVKLLQPEDPVTLATGDALVDAVRYSPSAPWPMSADGRGDSLNRTDGVAFGNFVGSWSAAEPSPGNVVFGATSADFDENGVIDGFDFLRWQRGFGTPSPNATLADGDANGDRRVDAQDLDVWEASFGDAAIADVALTVGTAVESTHDSSTAGFDASSSSLLTPSLVDFAILDEMDAANDVGDHNLVVQSMTATDSSGTAPLVAPDRARTRWNPPARLVLTSLPAGRLAQCNESKGAAAAERVDSANAGDWDQCS